MIPNKELIEQLALAGDSMVRAVVQLRSSGQPALGANCRGDFDVLAHEVLERVADKVGHAAYRTNILRNAEAIILEADPSFLREMIKQPEIVSALPSYTTARISMPPINKRPVKKGGTQHADGQ